MSTSAPLQDLSVGTGLGEYLRSIWERRDFLIVVPRHDARAKDVGKILGGAWQLLNPILMTTVYFVVFGLILGVDRGVDSFIAFLTIGVLLFQLCQRTTQSAATAITSNVGLIRSVQFPRALLPLSVSLRNLVTFGPAALVILTVSFAQTRTVTWHVVVFPVAVLCAFLISTGFALLSARVGAFAEDLRDILPHAFRILLYFSGVLFEVDRLVSNSTVRTILRFNPIFDFVNLARWSLIGTPVPRVAVVSLAFWTLVIPSFGMWMFHRQEYRYGS